ncbi:MAG: M14 family metallopeptidase [Sneathiella sp.]|uniref:M14 family metallopeptidase n=1 Tax=Sneathiella sp. TaxID=1964365 RepID=UPI003002B3C2
MNISNYFSPTYAVARQKFLDACNALEIPVENHLNDEAKGAEGEELYMDVARIGPINASKVLIISSGTHGGEGFCGSGVQVGMLQNDMFTKLPQDTAVLLIHAINPYGFSHVRRVNENNIDLNRNFLDYSKGLPENPAYADVHPLIIPDDWDGPARAAADTKIEDYIADKGLSTYQAAVSGGQHIHEDGIFFGGFGPSWTNKTLRNVVSKHAGSSKHLALLDFHTGLGPYGHGEPIYVGNPEGLSRAMEWYGDDVTSPEAGTSSSAVVRGTIDNGVTQMAPNASHTCVAIEYGTLPVIEVLNALRADNWLYVKGDKDSEQGKAIKKQVRDAFYCDADDWKEMIWTRGISMIQMALVGLNKA